MESSGWFGPFIHLHTLCLVSKQGQNLPEPSSFNLMLKFDLIYKKISLIICSKDAILKVVKTLTEELEK